MVQRLQKLQILQRQLRLQKQQKQQMLQRQLMFFCTNTLLGKRLKTYGKV